MLKDDLDATKSATMSLPPDLYFLRVIAAHSENMLKMVKQ